MAAMLVLFLISPYDRNVDRNVGEACSTQIRKIFGPSGCRVCVSGVARCTSIAARQYKRSTITKIDCTPDLHLMNRMRRIGKMRRT